jgi:magnesium transporter
MTAEAAAAVNRRFLNTRPGEAAQHLAAMAPRSAAEVLALLEPAAQGRVLERMDPDSAASVLEALSPAEGAAVLAAMMEGPASAVLARLEPDRAEEVLAVMSPAAAWDLRARMAYPPETAGARMDPRFLSSSPTATTGEVLERLRRSARRPGTVVYLRDEAGRLHGQVPVADLALAPTDFRVGEIAEQVGPIGDLDPVEEVAERLHREPAAQLPVVDAEGRLVGVLRAAALVNAVEDAALGDLSAMVGAGREERALATARQVVGRRLPWLLINLLTAFLAAAVVGVFEGTISRVTALAVFMPVVAGQAGNAGAQALAITMRGLALREIGVRAVWRVAGKEVRAGMLNGLAVAVVVAGIVFAFGGSPGLILVLMLAMVISLAAAGLAGAVIPVALTRLGQDPAQSSSIFLTTVTDVVGFLSFLGIASLLVEWL